MPVYKYRSVADMPSPSLLPAGADLADRMRAVWGRGFLICPPVLRRGVRRFRTIEDANRERERETAERLRRRAGPIR